MADGFEEWYARRVDNEKGNPLLKDFAWEAWRAGRDNLLAADGRPLPEVIAVNILKGEGIVGVLADWMVERGMIGEEDARKRIQEWRDVLGEMKKMLSVAIFYHKNRGVEPEPKTVELYGRICSLLGVPNDLEKITGW